MNVDWNMVFLFLGFFGALLLLRLFPLLVDLVHLGFIVLRLEFTKRRSEKMQKEAVKNSSKELKYPMPPVTVSPFMDYDHYKHMASIMYNVPVDEVTKEMRDQAKIIGFATAYSNPIAMWKEGRGSREYRPKERVVVSRAYMGLCFMQVCAVKDATAKEILAVANSHNPSGTSAGWCKVYIGSDKEAPDKAPVPCEDDPERMHFLVSC